MSDTTPGATEIDVLPRDAASATAMRERLMADPEWLKSSNTDESKRSLAGYLRWVAGGQDPDRWAKPPEVVGDVHAQASDRAVQAAEQHAKALDKQFDLTPRQQFEVLARRPVYQHEKDAAANELLKKTRDVEYMQRWRNGDRVAQTEIYLLNAVKAAPNSRLTKRPKPFSIRRETLHLGFTQRLAPQALLLSI
jgi:hypothetical protein